MPLLNSADLAQIRSKSIEHQIYKEMDSFKKHAIANRVYGKVFEYIINQGMGFHELIKTVGVGENTLTMSNENSEFFKIWQEMSKWLSNNQLVMKVNQYKYENIKTVEPYFYVINIASINK